MATTVKALQNLYVAKGGALTDTYNNIADGAQVGDYVTIPDMINAEAQLIATQVTANTNSGDDIPASGDDTPATGG